MTLPESLQHMLGQQGLNVKGLRKDQYRIGIDLHQTLYDGGSTPTASTNIAA